MHGGSLVKRHVLKKIELRPLISGFDFALLEVRNLYVASRLYMGTAQLLFEVEQCGAVTSPEVASLEMTSRKLHHRGDRK
jgi:hypothetical protein